MKKSFAMLAQTYNPNKYNVEGWYASEKMDGMRAIWDGGISRGLPAAEVPWANCLKHGRFKNQVFATGLWTRYGQPIQAPKEFLDSLPPFCMDGELWAGHKQFQTVASVVRSLSGANWKLIKYIVFDVPSIFDLFGDRTINETNMKVEVVGCVEWAVERSGLINIPNRDMFLHTSWTLEETIVSDMVGKIWNLEFNNVFWNVQHHVSSQDDIEHLLGHMTDAEGLILRHPLSMWTPERTHDMLKVKKRHDAEGTVVGYTWGRQTNLGSKLLGKMGALILKTDTGLTFELSGFTDEERIMCAKSIMADPTESMILEGQKATEAYYNPKFPIGSRITYQYRELTNDGLPKEASYYRKVI